MRRTLPLIALAALLGGCSSLKMPEPWVKPYEREKLADPIMQFSRTALADKHREHMWDPLESTCRHASLSIL